MLASAGGPTRHLTTRETIVAELTPAADRYIGVMLSRDGQVPAEALDWVPEPERVDLLQQYCAAHAADVVMQVVGEVLVADLAAQPPMAPSPAAATPEPPAPPAPPVPSGAVTSGYSAPPSFDNLDLRSMVAASDGKALLDSKPAGAPVSRWLYLLPLLFGLLGGLIGWLIVRDENPHGGRNLLTVGAVVTVISLCFSVAMAGVAGSALWGMKPAAKADWPAAGVATARPALYYFGTST